ncbi:hypothetical protein WDW86_11140 [Bdellovibrionota bacterium FG-2]
MDAVSADRVSRSGGAIAKALRDVAGAAGVDEGAQEGKQAIDNALERLSNDFNGDSRTFAVSGRETGAFDSDHRYLAIIDTENMQIVVFAAGYSE